MTTTTLKLSAESANPLYVRVADTVCDALASGQLAPGDRLPPQTTLARDLGISALTVGKGYDLLRMRGIVAAHRGRGTYVKNDAVRYARQTDKRQFGTLHLVCGETSLSVSQRETLFIVADILDGVRDVFGPRSSHVDFVESLTASSLLDITDHDAVLALAPREIDAAYLTDLQTRGIPVLKVWNFYADLDAPAVRYDVGDAATLACQHLIDCGYRRIGFIGVRRSREHKNLGRKFTAYVAALNEAGLDVSARYIRDVQVYPGQAYAAASEIIRDGDAPDAIFVDTDYKAMEVIAALRAAGLRVPEDIGIVGYDDIPEAAAFDPPLTTVSVPRREIGRCAAKRLQNWPADGSVMDDIVLDANLIQRQSTKKVK